MRDFVLIVNIVVLCYFIVLNSVYMLASIASFWALRKYAKRSLVADFEELITYGGPPAVTLLVPGYNEEKTCVESLRSMLTLRYPHYDIIYINDGSKDSTLARLIASYDMEPAVRAPTAFIKTAKIHGIYRSKRHPMLWLVDKENGGKADALNVGINFCRSQLFCAMDSDTLLERDALMRVVRPFLEDYATVAVGGVVRIVNDSTVQNGVVTDVRMPLKLLPQLQVLEYMRAFLAGRVGFGAIDTTMIISGAFGVFRRDVVVAVNGYRVDTVGEDMELVVRLHRYCRERKMRYHIAHIPDTVAWTECPESLKVLGRQRDRWQRGLIETMWRNKRMLLNPRYGRIGLLGYPYYFFLEMIGPIIETLGYVSFAVTLYYGWASLPYIVAFMVVAVVLGISLSLAAVALEEMTFRRYARLSEMLRLLGLCFLDNMGFRQLNSFWRTKGFLTKLFRRSTWGKMERKGFAPSPPPPSVPPSTQASKP